MAQHLHHHYAVDLDVTRERVREALREITDDDITNKSPITAGCEEVGIEFHGDGEDRLLHINVEGHPGEWSKTSEEHLQPVVSSINGVYDCRYAEGGYEG